MTSGDRDHTPRLNEHQVRRVVVTCKYVDKVIGDIEGVLNSSTSKAAFPQYIQDITPIQRRIIDDYVARIRAQLTRVTQLRGKLLAIPW